MNIDQIREFAENGGYDLIEISIGERTTRVLFEHRAPGEGPPRHRVLFPTREDLGATYQGLLKLVNWDIRFHDTGFRAYKRESEPRRAERLPPSLLHLTRLATTEPAPAFADTVPPTQPEGSSSGPSPATTASPVYGPVWQHPGPLGFRPKKRII